MPRGMAHGRRFRPLRLLRGPRGACGGSATIVARSDENPSVWDKNVIIKLAWEHPSQ